MACIVQKFGGTSVADIERIQNVAKKVKAEVDKGNQVVVKRMPLLFSTALFIRTNNMMPPCATRPSTTPPPPHVREVNASGVTWARLKTAR